MLIFYPLGTEWRKEKSPNEKCQSPPNLRPNHIAAGYHYQRGLIFKLRTFTIGTFFMAPTKKWTDLSFLSQSAEGLQVISAKPRTNSLKSTSPLQSESKTSMTRLISGFWMVRMNTSLLGNQSKILELGEGKSGWDNEGSRAALYEYTVGCSPHNQVSQLGKVEKEEPHRHWRQCHQLRLSV